MNLSLRKPIAIGLVVAMSFFSSYAAHSRTRADLDRDGIPNRADRDVDNDGIENGRDRNIDGGIARSGPRSGRWIGDRLSNRSLRELDMDADGLRDNSAREADIDGDGLEDAAPDEHDVDGDGLADGLDRDVDGDGLANGMDADFDGTGNINDVFVGGEVDSIYAPDDTVAPTIAFVDGEIRRILQIPATDDGLRVRVNRVPSGNLVTGLWRYLSTDHIQVHATWCYPSDNPSALKIFALFQYSGPDPADMEDYSDPANYAVSEESRLYAQYPRGPLTFVSWLRNDPAGFFYTAQNEEATGLAPPYEALRVALEAMPAFSSDQDYLSFSGNFSSDPGLSSLQPVIDLQRTIMQVSWSWYGQLEAERLR